MGPPGGKDARRIAFLLRVEVNDRGGWEASFSIARTLGLIDASPRWRLRECLGPGEDVWLYILLGRGFVLEGTQAEYQKFIGVCFASGGIREESAPWSSFCQVRGMAGFSGH